MRGARPCAGGQGSLTVHRWTPRPLGRLWMLPRRTTCQNRVGQPVRAGGPPAFYTAGRPDAAPFVEAGYPVPSPWGCSLAAWPVSIRVRGVKYPRSLAMSCWRAFPTTRRACVTRSGCDGTPGSPVASAAPSMATGGRWVTVCGVARRVAGRPRFAGCSCSSKSGGYAVLSGRRDSNLRPPDPQSAIKERKPRSHSPRPSAP